MNTLPRHIALQFGRIKHFHEGLAEFSRQLATQYALAAKQLKEERNWNFHFILPKQWHGMFGADVQYHDLIESMRLRHEFPVALDVWHGLHQHMRHRPPVNCRHKFITVHDINHVYAKKGLSLWWQNARLIKQLKNADELITISQFVADELASHFAPKQPISVIYNGVADLSPNKKTPPKNFEGKGYLLHLSRMSESKNTGALINLAKVWPEKHFVFAGPDSPEVQKHKATAYQLGLQNTTFLTDVTEAEKAWLYEHCSAFLFPSLYEGFGLPPIEAMHFKKPVMTSQRTSLPEVCGNYAGYWQDYEPASMRAATEAFMTKVEENLDLRNAIKERAAKFKWNTARDAYLMAYEKCINSKSPRIDA